MQMVFKNKNSKAPSELNTMVHAISDIKPEDIIGGDISEISS